MGFKLLISIESEQVHWSFVICHSNRKWIYYVTINDIAGFDIMFKISWETNEDELKVKKIPLKKLLTFKSFSKQTQWFIWKEKYSIGNPIFALNARICQNFHTVLNVVLTVYM